jgi:HSP20 family protein
MSPWKKRDRFFDDFFRDFEEEFRNIEENVSRIFEDASRMTGKPGESNPLIYGFSMRVGPEGEPRIERFGNIPMDRGEQRIADEREPLIDVIEKDSDITVVAELPGIEKEDISLNVSEDTLEVDVDTATRRYHKRLQLPAKVKPDVTKSTYKNGVLEVRLGRAEKKRKKSVRINVE